jgi:hypothetical protein
MKRNVKTSKIGFLFVLLIIIMIFFTSIGGSFGWWHDNLQVEGTITTIDIHKFYNIVGYWKFDEDSGGIAYDSSINFNDGTIYEAGWISGKVGSCLGFDGLNDYVEVPDDDSLDITDECTIETWINADVIDTYKSIIVKGDANIEGKINYGLQIQSEVTPGTLRFFKYDESYTWIDSISQVPADGKWHHIAVTVDGANNVNFFIDGAPSGTGTFTLGPISDSSLYIGMHKHYSGGSSQYWAGQIDEVKIFNCALDASEIQAIYNI